MMPYYIHRLYVFISLLTIVCLSKSSGIERNKFSDFEFSDDRSIQTCIDWIIKVFFFFEQLLCGIIITLWSNGNNIISLFIIQNLVGMCCSNGTRSSSRMYVLSAEYEGVPRGSCIRVIFPSTLSIQVSLQD